jgi:hypothetical protein
MWAWSWDRPPRKKVREIAKNIETHTFFLFRHTPTPIPIIFLLQYPPPYTHLLFLYADAPVSSAQGLLAQSDRYGNQAKISVPVIFFL